MDPYRGVILICPFNCFCYNFFGNDFYMKLKDRLVKTVAEGREFKLDHHREIQYKTAKHMLDRLNAYERAMENRQGFK